jgi:hypothetical protein
MGRKDGFQVSSADLAKTKIVSTIFGKMDHARAQ